MSLWNSFMKWVGLSPAGGPPSSLTSVMKENPKPQPVAKPKKTGIEMHKEEKAVAKPKPAAKPKPKPRAKKKAAPKETVDSLNKLTKANIQALAKKNLKIDLDVKTTKKVMIENFILAQSE